jgi:hypothetical protein
MDINHDIENFRKNLENFRIKIKKLKWVGIFDIIIDNLKRYIIIIIPVLWVVTSYIYDYSNWLIYSERNQPFVVSQLTIIGVYVTAFLTLFFIGKQIVDNTEMQKTAHDEIIVLHSDITALQNELKYVRDTGVDSTKTSIDFIRRAFGLFTWLELITEHNKNLVGAMHAIGFNLRNWEGHIIKEDKNELIKDTAMIDLVLQFMRTYFFEEAFDIKQKELITNGRNFSFILLSTVSTLINDLGKGEILEYYSVTPVHPKDWYNWPHGYVRDYRAYHEEFIVSLFYRGLREIINFEKDKNNIIHGRFVLTRKNEAKTIRENLKVFGWDIDDSVIVKTSLKNSWMMPIAIPIDKLEEAQDVTLSAFSTYYNWINQREVVNSEIKLGKILPDSNGNPEEHIYIIPLFCESWVEEVDKWFDKKIKLIQNEDLKIKFSHQNAIIIQALQTLQRTFTNPKGEDLKKLAINLKTIASNFYEGEIKKYCKIIDPKDSDSCTQQCKKEWPKVETMVKNILENPNGNNFPNFLEEIHFFSVVLSENKEEPILLFCWDDVVNKDNEQRRKLVKFLKEEFPSIDWLNNAKFEEIKIETVDVDHVKVSSGINNFCLSLNKTKNLLNIKVGGIRSFELIGQSGSKINIYRKMDRQNALQNLMMACLRLRDCQQSLVDTWHNLGEVFATTLHSQQNLSKMVPLNDSALIDLDEKGIKPEFHIFGVMKLKFLFEWKEINNNNNALKNFLTEHSNINWQEYKIEVVSDNTINVININNSVIFLSLALNSKKTEVNLKINGGRSETYLVKLENNEQNVYDYKQCEVDWKIIISTDMNYPFEIGKIKFITHLDPESGNYIDFIKILKGEKFSTLYQLEDVMWW